MTGVDFIPVALVAAPIAGTGLIAWGRVHTRIDTVVKEVDNKAEKDVVGVWQVSVDKRLDRIESKLDRALETR